MGETRTSGSERNVLIAAGIRLRVCFGIALLLSLVSCASAPQSRTETLSMGAGDESLVEKWGVEILSLRQSAGGYMLDFRYRVVDPVKAALFTDPKIKPYLIDEASGARFMVPSGGKVGALRSIVKSGPPETGRVYFVIFANPGKYVKQGNNVSVVVGDFKAEHLVVE